MLETDGEWLALVEARLRRPFAVHAEDDDASEVVPRVIETGAGHLPFGPDLVPVDRVVHHLGVDVRDEREDLSPVRPDLLPPAKRAAGMGGSLVAVLGGEAVDQGVEVVRVGGGHQPAEEGVDVGRHGRLIFVTLGYL